MERGEYIYPALARWLNQTGTSLTELEEAQAAAALGQYRVACACWLERWEPVREAVT